MFICKVLALLSKAEENRPILFELIGQKLIISVAGLSKRQFSEWTSIVFPQMKAFPSSLPPSPSSSSHWI